MSVTESKPEAIRRIAGQLRHLPERKTVEPHVHRIGNVGGRLLQRAIELGAFGGSDYDAFREHLAFYAEVPEGDRGYFHRNMAVLHNAAQWLRGGRYEANYPYTYAWTDLQRCCNTVADGLDREAHELAAAHEAIWEDVRADLEEVGACYRPTPEGIAVVEKLRPVADREGTPDATADPNTPVSVESQTARKATAKPWSPPPNYICATDIEYGEKFKVNGRGPVRTTVQRWEDAYERQVVLWDPANPKSITEWRDGNTDLRIVKSPDGTNYYPLSWVRHHHAKWADRKRRQERNSTA